MILQSFSFWKNLRKMCEDKNQLQTVKLLSFRVHLKTHPSPQEISDNWKPFKNNEKCFLLHVQSSFRFWEIYIFVLTFWLSGCLKKGQHIGCQKRFECSFKISEFVRSDNSFYD